MAARKISYYLTLISPWAYIGHDFFHAIAARHGCVIDYRPVSLSRVFPETGGQPLAQRHPARQAYRLLELQRWRDKRGVALELQPKYFPCDIALADKTVLALADSGGDVASFARAVHVAAWRDGRNCADHLTLAGLLREAGLPESLLAKAEGAEYAARYAALTGEAINHHIFGSPSYVLDGEVFWGQDRLELLEEALASGREAYRP